MGCWSESCAVSGLEIPHNAKIYVAMVGESRYGRDVEVNVPPVAGTYDDYGGLDLTETLTSLDLKTGENWAPRDDKRGMPVYIDAEVFDFLPSIELEFSYKGPKTIGESLEVNVTKLRDIIARLRPLTPYKDEAYYKTISELDRVIGYHTEAFADAKDKLSRILFKKDDTRTTEEIDAQIEEFITLYSRAFIFNRAQHELRKRFVPEVKGPQHAGSDALIAFYRTVYTLIRQRREAQVEEGYHQVEMDKDYPLDRWKAEVALDQTQLAFRDWQVEQEFKRED
jgi:hypothetical protein